MLRVNVVNMRHNVSYLLLSLDYIYYNSMLSCTYSILMVEFHTRFVLAIFTLEKLD